MFLRRLVSKRTFGVLCSSAKQATIARRCYSKAVPVTTSLLNTLDQEIKHELSAGPAAIGIKIPESGLDYLKEYKYELVNNVGEDKVVLTKKDGSEDLTLSFDIEQLFEEEEDEEFDEETRLDGTLDIKKNIDSKEMKMSIDFTLGPEYLEVNSVSMSENYRGPTFDTLSEELQQTFIDYLESKGVNDKLSEFITDYTPQKEGKEYLNWLQQLQEFVRHK